MVSKSAPRLLGGVGWGRGLPIKGRAGAIIYHLSVTLHLKVCITIVTTIIFKLVYSLRGNNFKKGSEHEQGQKKKQLSPHVYVVK